jgi:protocatechuate 3,4-dioxygenase, alpha subunit
MRALTPFQTIGPFFHALVQPGSCRIAGPLAKGERIELRGKVWDGARAPVTDALIEIWQADPLGRFAQPEPRTEHDAACFHGFGRFATDASGAFAFDTLLPGPTPGPDGSMQAPHLLVQIFARGILSRLVTRIYFEGQALNEEDPILACVPRERRGTLIARRRGASTYEIEILLQGDGETVFFDV